jgi:hypothetical protein
MAALGYGAPRRIPAKSVNYFDGNMKDAHFFYSASNQPHSVQTDQAVIFDHFLPILDARDPVIATRFCLESIN